MSHHNDRQISTDNRYSMVGLSEPKNCFNVGAALRACGCFDAKMLVATGDRFMKKGDWRHTDTDRTHKKIPFIHSVPDLRPFLPEDCVPVAIEVDPTAIPLPEFKHPDRAFYIFGPEDGAVPAATLAWCAHKVYIPMSYCSNLAATSYMVLYDRMTKFYNEPKVVEPKCPKCGSSHYIIDGAPTDPTYSHNCQACGYIGGSNEWLPNG